MTSVLVENCLEHYLIVFIFYPTLVFLAIKICIFVEKRL